MFFRMKKNIPYARFQQTSRAHFSAFLAGEKFNVLAVFFSYCMYFGLSAHFQIRNICYTWSRRHE